MPDDGPDLQDLLNLPFDSWIPKDYQKVRQGHGLQLEEGIYEHGHRTILPFPSGNASPS